MNTLKIKNEIQSSIDVKVSLLTDDALVGQIFDLAERCSNSLRSGGKIIFCGNGGSFADAQHLSAEFTSRFLLDRESLASIALGTNNSAITAIGNDYGYENVFSREIQSIGNRGDILIPITTSGNSANILRVIEVAEQKNIYTVVFTGINRGKLNEKVECLNIPSSVTARIQECHIMIGHIICGLVEAELFGDKLANNE